MFDFAVLINLLLGYLGIMAFFVSHFKSMVFYASAAFILLILNFTEVLSGVSHLSQVMLILINTFYGFKLLTCFFPVKSAA